MTMPVPPMRSARFTLADNHFEGGGLAPRGRVPPHERSPRDGGARPERRQHGRRARSSSGGTLLLPAHVLGSRYRALTYAQVVDARAAGHAGLARRRGPARRRRHGRRHPRHDRAVGDGEPRPGRRRPPPGPDGQLHLTLDDGDLFTLYSNRDGADLTGTRGLGRSTRSPCSRATSRRPTGSRRRGSARPTSRTSSCCPSRAWGTALRRRAARAAGGRLRSAALAARHCLDLDDRRRPRRHAGALLGGLGRRRPRPIGRSARARPSTSRSPATSP